MITEAHISPSFAIEIKPIQTDTLPMIPRKTRPFLSINDKRILPVIASEHMIPRPMINLKSVVVYALTSLAYRMRHAIPQNARFEAPISVMPFTGFIFDMNKPV
jgi:hypothetical protein